MSPDHNSSSAPFAAANEIADGSQKLRGAGATASQTKELADALGNTYMGITCSICGSSRVIRAGACGACLNCGNSTGC